MPKGPEAAKENRDKIEALQADDVAKALVCSFAQPANVDVQEASMMPAKQAAP
jgi:NADP-dependent 3-hydroxy acid dehydrogenase YdfG